MKVEDLTASTEFGPSREASVLRRLSSFLSLLSLSSLLALGCTSPPEDQQAPNPQPQVQVNQTPVPTPTPRPPEKLELEGGVIADVSEWGIGPLPGDGDAVRLQYVLRNEEGEVLDDTREREGLFEVILGDPGTLPGLDSALRQLPPGSKATLTLPASSAFADRGYGDIIPPGATLLLDVEILGSVPADSAGGDATRP
jgi:FKBP-type peptidyl-prolyl cis-trans isomerase